jgi:hypothetical protein
VLAELQLVSPEAAEIYEGALWILEEPANPQRARFRPGGDARTDRRARQERRRGTPVIPQANVLGSKRWITFRRATTGAKERFRASYQFTSTTQHTVYRFRAEVPVQAGYQWLAGSDRPVRVVVTP